MRPPVVWTAALLYLAGALRAVLAIVIPMSASMPVGAIAATGALCTIIAVSLWLWGSHLRGWGMQAVIAATTVTASVLVALAATEAGTVLAAFAYPWIAVYCAHFFRPRAVVAHLTLISVGYGAALLANPL